MAQAQWRQKLQQNARKTAQFWAEEGVAITQDESRPTATNRALALGMGCVAAGLAANFSLSTAAETWQWGEQARAVLDMAAVTSTGILGMGAAASFGSWAEQWLSRAEDQGQRGATPSPVEGNERQRELQQAVGQLFETMDNDPAARAELVSLLQTDEGRDLFLNTLESRSPEQAAQHLLRSSQAGVDFPAPDDDTPSSGPSQS